MRSLIADFTLVDQRFPTGLDQLSCPDLRLYIYIYVIYSSVPKYMYHLNSCHTPTSHAWYFHWLRVHNQVITWQNLKTLLNKEHFGTSIYDDCDRKIVFNSFRTMAVDIVNRLLWHALRIIASRQSC